MSKSDRTAEEGSAQRLGIVGVGKLDLKPRLLDVDEGGRGEDPGQ
jgi:hypothetical protein